MDQLKQQLSAVLPYGFWFGSAIVLLGSVAVWHMSTGELNSQSVSQIGRIKADVQKVNSLRQEMTDQPNQKSHDEMQRMISARENEVLRAWSSIYEDQRRILTWPKTVQLRDDFIDEFRHPKDPETGKFDKTRQKLPYEMYVNFPIEESQMVPQFILRNYERYIGKILPDIAKIANAQWTADFESKTKSGLSGIGGAARAKPEITIGGQQTGPLVQWSGGSQGDVMDDLFPWRGRRPTTLEVYYSQENLWILKQLLEIVAKVNGDAKQPFEAKIRQINQLAIGKSVKFGAGDLASVRAEATGMAGMEDYSSGEMMGAEISMGFSRESEGDPADYRYVDTKLTPITGSALRAALKSNSPNDASLAVAKRVPVMMSLKMDQRFVPTLLAECGNAPLMVDVRQVRVLPAGGSTSSPSAESFGGEMGYGSGSTVKRARDEFPMDLNVEVYGLIYIYNPPNREALGVDKVTVETEVDGTKIGDTVAPPTESALPAPSAVPDGTALPDATTVPAEATPPTGPAAGLPGATPAEAPPPAAGDGGQVPPAADTTQPPT